MRILTLDIETQPALARVWRLFKENIPLARLEEVTEVCAVGAKWLDKRSVEYVSIYDDGREAMLEQVHQWMDDADAIVHYNGVNFDMRHLRTQLVIEGYMPPSDHRDIDLFRVVKDRFKFDSNKLDHVASQLGLGGKVKHDGYDLWRGCQLGDLTSIRKMKRYCVGDVRLTEQLYLKLRPWIRTHPNAAVFDVIEGMCCRTCTGTNLIVRGYHTTNSLRYPKMQCTDCGSYTRAKSAVKDDTVARNAA